MTNELGGSQMSERGFSALATLNMLLSHRRMLVLTPLLLMTLALAATLMRRPAFRAESTFVPQTQERDLAQFAGLAAQFGVNLAGGSESGESPDFYVWLLRSRELLRNLSYTTFDLTTSGAPRRGNLYDLLEVSGPTAAERERSMLELLRQQVTATLDPKTSVVTLRTRAPSRDLAVAMNRRLLDQVNAFNLATRQTQSRAERQFVQGRLAEAQAELRRAEERASQFLQENRQFDGSPRLTFEYSRLQRQIDLHQQLYTSLAQAYEQARIEEVRNLPLISIIGPPENSVVAVRRGLIMNVMLAGIAGLVIAIMMAVLLDYARRQRTEQPAEFAEFERLSASLLPMFRRRIRMSNIPSSATVDESKHTR